MDAPVVETVDAKAELTSLLETWEQEQQGSTDNLVSTLTKSVNSDSHTNVSLPLKHVFFSAVLSSSIWSFFGKADLLYAVVKT